MSVGRPPKFLPDRHSLLALEKQMWSLSLVTPAQLGFTSDTVSLTDVYVACSTPLALNLPQPRSGRNCVSSILDQPMGEFIIIGMEPIKTWSGEPIVLNVANGGAGLILIGQDGRAETAATSQFVFARSRQSAPSPNSSARRRQFCHREGARQHLWSTIRCRLRKPGPEAKALAGDRPVSMLRAFVGINALCTAIPTEIIHLRERRPHDRIF